MDLFGTGQSSGGGQTQTRQRSPEEQEAMARFGLGGIAILATLKYLPVVITGLILGSIVNRGARGAYGFQRFKQLTLGLAFFALTLFSLIGLPMPEGQQSGNLFGILYSYQEFKDLISQALNAWNKELNFPIIKVLRFDLQHMTYQTVTNYFWIMIATAAVLVIALEAWAQLKPKNKTTREVYGFGTKLCRLPQVTMRGMIHLIFKRWVKSGRQDAWSIQENKLLGFLRPFVRMLIITLLALIAIEVLPKSLNLDMATKNIIFCVMMLPVAGIFIGFLIGCVDFAKNLVPLPTLKTRPNEFKLGNDFQGKPYGLSEQNLSYHVEVIAPTGSGKTNLLKNLIADRIQKGHGIIFLDLKAEFQVVSWMMRAAMAANRAKDLRLVSLANRELSVPYNPIKMGSAPEIHSQLMNSMSWSEDYYRKISSMALMTILRGLCEYRDRTGECFHLGHLYDLLNEQGLLRALGAKLTAMNCPSARDVDLLCEKLDRSSERDKLTGLTANIGLLIHSAAGALISQDVTAGSFDFKEAVDQGRITYVLMNSMKLRETAQVFGKMILQDLMRLAGDRYSQIDGMTKHRSVTLVIDEFAAFAIPEFIEFMDRARGAGIGIVFAHQSRADLRSLSPEFQERCEANANTVIVSGVKTSEDAEHFAGMIGTKTVTKETRQVEDGFFGQKNTGMKSLREVEEYIVHPNILKDLHQGEAFTVSRTVDPRWALVRIPEAQEFTGQPLSSGDLVKALESIRATYMINSHEKYLDLVALKAVPGLARAPMASEPVKAETNAGIWN